MKKENKAIFMIVLITLATAIVLFSVHLHQTAKITTSSLTQQDLVGLAAPPAQTVLDQVKGAKVGDMFIYYGNKLEKQTNGYWICINCDDKTPIKNNEVENSAKEVGVSFQSAKTGTVPTSTSNFPITPSKGDTFKTPGGVTYKYDNGNWVCTDCPDGTHENQKTKTQQQMKVYFDTACTVLGCEYKGKTIITTTPSLQQFQDGNIIYTNGGKKYIVDHDSYGDDKVYVCKDDKCNTKELCEKCKVDTKGKLNDDGKELGDDPDKIRSDSKDFCKTNMKDEKCDYYATQLASYANIATAPVRAEIERTVGGFASDLLNAAYITHLDSVICGAKYYYDTSGEKGTPVTLGGFELGKSSIPSLQKKDPLNDIYGDIFAGKGQIMKLGGSKEEVIENKLYRYTLSIKLLGQMQYKLYLSNSCDKNINSLFEGGFSKEGDLTVQGAPDYNVGNYIDYIAGTTLTFDCSKGPCRFNEVCIEHNAPDIANPNCIPLAHGAGFLHKNATSTC